MPRHRRMLVAPAAAWLVVAALAGGCQTPPPQTQRPPVQFDACAERLHDLCGQFLLYYSAHRKLPPTVADLAAAGSLSSAPPVCPVSRRPYVYNPSGLTVPGRKGRVVLYDAEPCHSGMRWGVLVDTPAGGGLITANVILLSENELISAEQRPPPRPRAKQ
jgi:hypothetical protein